MKPSWSRLILSVFIAAALVAFVRLKPWEKDRAMPASQLDEESLRPAASPSPAKASAPAATARGTPATAEQTTEREPASRSPVSRSPASIFVELLARGEWNPQPGAQGAKTGFIGRPIPGGAADAPTALELARAAARQLGVAPEQLSLEHAEADAGTGLQTLHRFGQWVDGFEVFDGDLRVLARRSDSAVYLINSTLKPVDRAPSDPGAIDRAAARRLVEAHYRERGGKIVSPEVATAVIYADARPIELAWVFYVEISSPRLSKLQTLLGATSRQVVYESPVLRH